MVSNVVDAVTMRGGRQGWKGVQMVNGKRVRERGGFKEGEVEELMGRI